MPELPEVETVRRGLALSAPPGTRIVRVEKRRRDLRFPFPRRLTARLGGRTIRGYRRWGKYLLWDTDGETVLSHLGMSGSWRTADRDERRPHDHLLLHLDNGRTLAYHDPRRFGFLNLVPSGGDESAHPRLAHLGPDALDREGFDGAHLQSALRGRKAPVKALLLDQRIVAGVGNIYACEALFRSGIRPRTAAGRLTGPRLTRLVADVRDVLGEAIDSGGSTLRDYLRPDGTTGYFQHRFAVYDRAGEPCLTCASALKGAVVGGRATVWCPTCQR